MINRKKSNQKYYKKKKKNKEAVNAYQREYNKEKNGEWNKLPEDKKLQLMNQFSKELMD
jgi:hypothetical protein